MFTESVRIGCSYLACSSGSAKYQTCLTFYCPSTTLYPDLGSARLETILLWTSTACRLHFPSSLQKLAVLLWLSNMTPPPDRPIRSLQ